MSSENRQMSWLTLGGEMTLFNDSDLILPESIFTLKDENARKSDGRTFASLVSQSAFDNTIRYNECFAFFASVYLTQLKEISSSYYHEYLSNHPTYKLNKRERVEKTFNDVIIPAYKRAVRIYDKKLYLKSTLTGNWHVMSVPVERSKDLENVKYRDVFIDYKNETGRLFEFTYAINHLFEEWAQSVEICRSLAKSLLDSVYVKSVDSDIVMFNDAALFPTGELLPIRDIDASTFSPYTISNDIFPLLESHDENVPKELNELLNNLSNNDEDVKDFMLDTFAMSLCLSISIKKSRARMLVFDDPVGSSGKSTLIEVIKNALGTNVVTTFSVTSAQDERRVSKIPNALFMYDTEGGGFINIASANTLKQLITGDTMAARKLYSESEDFVPRAQLVVTTNSFGKCDDKTGGWLRRLAIIKPRLQLKEHNDAWFNRLRSETTANWLLAELVIRAQKIILSSLNPNDDDGREESNLINLPTSIKLNVDEYNGTNVNALDFIASELADVNAIIPKKAYQMYVEWCEISNVTALKSTRFNDAMKHSGFVRKKNANVSPTSYSDIYQQIVSNDVEKINAERIRVNLFIREGR